MQLKLLLNHNKIDLTLVIMIANMILTHQDYK